MQAVTVVVHLIAECAKNAQHEGRECGDAAAEAGGDHDVCWWVSPFDRLPIRTRGKTHYEAAHGLGPDDGRDAFSAVCVERDESFTSERAPNGSEGKEAKDGAMSCNFVMRAEGKMVWFDLFAWLFRGRVDLIVGIVFRG